MADEEEPLFRFLLSRHHAAAGDDDQAQTELAMATQVWQDRLHTSSRELEQLVEQLTFLHFSVFRANTQPEPGAQAAVRGRSAPGQAVRTHGKITPTSDGLARRHMRRHTRT